MHSQLSHASNPCHPAMVMLCNWLRQMPMKCCAELLISLDAISPGSFLLSDLEFLLAFAALAMPKQGNILAMLAMNLSSAIYCGYENHLVFELSNKMHKIQIFKCLIFPVI